mgnify:CR=1 FL=1
MTDSAPHADETYDLWADRIIMAAFGAIGIAGFVMWWKLLKYRPSR